MMTRNLLEIVAMCGGVLHAAQGTADSVRATTVTGVFTDSRKVAPGGLFVAIAGEHDDGHQFVPAAARAGAVAILVHDLDGVRSALADAGLAPGSLNLITVSDTVEALGRLARAHLADLRERAAEQGRALTVVAMTGSVGKTTTKDLTRQILAAQAPTIAPAASFNNEIGLPLTVLRADETTRFLILEMGASAPGHIAYLTSIAPPDAAAVLVVGHAHMDGFGSLDGVARAKAEIIEGLLPTGTAVVNLDDERAAAMGELAPGPVLTFSAAGDARADLRADLVELDDGARPVIDLHLPGLSAPARVRLGLPGVHNVTNALGAAGLALAAGVRPEAVAAALGRAVSESPHRMDVRELELTGLNGHSLGILLIDDSYNANIDSMTAALDALPALAGERRRVVIVSEMLELGESSAADHARTGELAVQAGAALLLTIGRGAAPAAQAARAADVKTLQVADADAALDLLGSEHSPLRDGDAVLVKGSHDSGAWRLADFLVERSKEGTQR